MEQKGGGGGLGAQEAGVGQGRGISEVQERLQGSSLWLDESCTSGFHTFAPAPGRNIRGRGR